MSKHVAGPDSIAGVTCKVGSDYFEKDYRILPNSADFFLKNPALRLKSG
jgi:hypothetical protein